MENLTPDSLLMVRADLPPGNDLTLREVEVLKWSAQGKTAGEVAEILNLSSRTVNFHICSAIQKMGCCNKTSAAVRAALRGVF